MVGGGRQWLQVRGVDAGWAFEEDLPWECAEGREGLGILVGWPCGVRMFWLGWYWEGAGLTEALDWGAEGLYWENAD